MLSVDKMFKTFQAILFQIKVYNISRDVPLIGRIGALASNLRVIDSPNGLNTGHGGLCEGTSRTAAPRAAWPSPVVLETLPAVQR